MSAANNELLIFDSKAQEERDYWVERLSREHGASNLLPDYKRGRGPSAKTEAVELRLRGELFERLHKMTGDSPFLLYTILLSAIKVCLHKYTQNSTIITGSPVLKDRDGAPVKPNALAILNEIDDGMSFKEVLMGVREALLAAYAKQSYPFQRIVNDLGLEAQENRSPLFDIVVLLREIHGEMPELNNDITIKFAKGQGEVRGEIAYSGALFERGTVERFAGHIRNVLSAALENPNLLLHQLRMVEGDERQRLLVEMNEVAACRAPRRGIHQAVEAQAALRPDALAVTGEDGRLTYAELNGRANQLARYLRAQGITNESRVALLLERSTNMIVALLAILKAGAAYVPMDPAYPLQRLSFILEDARASLLITEYSLADTLADNTLPTLLMDAGWEQVAGHSTENLSLPFETEQAAYVIYTSGSTGKPKGVIVTHANVMRLFESTHRWYGFDERDVWTVFHSYAFDFSVWEIWGALCYGGRLSVVPYWVSRTPEAFYELLVNEGVTVLNQTPSAFRQLMQVDEAHGQELGLRVRCS